MWLNLKENTGLQFKILIVLGILFFFVYSFLNFGNELNKFTWPDETANYFFINNFSQHGNFSVLEMANKPGANLVKPRSFNVYNYNLVPGSFLGLILIYGLLAKVVGIFLIKFLTPLLAVTAVLFFYKILLKIFKPNIAFLSSLLFYTCPAWWYYANFSFLPNICFLAFIVIGFYFLLSIGETVKKNYWSVIIGSLFIGLALIIRTNEIIWILGLLAFLALIYRSHLKWRYVLIGGAIVVLVFVPILFYNLQTYGKALTFGYLNLDASSLATQLPGEIQTQNNWWQLVQTLILPFGFHPKVMLANFSTYYYHLFWWLFLPAVLGIFSLLKMFQKQAKAVYLVSFLGVSLYLLVYYGSWVFEDKMTLQLNQIGISYVRYFLPIYILSLPLVATFFFNLLSFFHNRKFKIGLILVLAALHLFFTVHVLYFKGADNLQQIKASIADYSLINKKIVSLTEPNAIIISQRSDKIFFPERRVIGKWQEEEITSWDYLLAAGYSLYYYAYEGSDYIYDFADLLANYYNLELTDEMVINAKESLYKIKTIEYESE